MGIFEKQSGVMMMHTLRDLILVAGGRVCTRHEHTDVLSSSSQPCFFRLMLLATSAPDCKLPAVRLSKVSLFHSFQCTILHESYRKAILSLLTALPQYVGVTALHLACLNQKVAVVKLLLERGADPNSVATSMV